MEGAPRASRRRSQLLQLALDRLVGDVLEVEARSRRRAAAPCARTAAPGRFSGTSPKMPGLAARLGRLDRVPVAQHHAGGLGLDLAEDVRVAPHELGVHVLGDLGQRAGAALLEQQREEVDLEEDVAELVEQLRVVARVRRGGQLVGLLDGVRDDRALVLLAVPRALDPQAPRELVEAPQRLDDLVARPAHRGGAQLPGCCCGGAPPAGVGVGVAFGPCLHCWIT